MSEKNTLIKRIITLVLALSLIISAVPFSVLSKIGTAYADTLKEHQMEFIDVTTEDEKYKISFGEDSSGQYDYVLEIYGSSQYMIKAKAFEANEKVWAVTELNNAIIHAYTVKEITADEYTKINVSIGNEGNAVFICVGEEIPTVNKTNPRAQTIDFHESVNSVYTLGQKSRPILDKLVIKDANTGEENNTLSPAFDSFTNEYTVSVSYVTRTLSIEAGIGEYYVGENLIATSKGTTKIAIGEGTDAPWNEDGEIELVFKTKNSSGEYGKEYKITLKGIYTPPLVNIKRGAVFSYSGEEKSLPLEIEADNGGKGELSYQWYCNNEESNEGGTPIKGANESSYLPEMVDLGNSLIDRIDYYYCKVTNTVEGNEYETVSSPVYAETRARLAIKVAAADGSDIPEGGYEYYDEGKPLTGPVLTVKFDETAGGEEGQWTYEWCEEQKKNSGTTYETIGTDKECSIPIHEGAEYSNRYLCFVTYTIGDKSKTFNSDYITISKYNLILNPVVTITENPQSAEYIQGCRDLSNLNVEASVSEGAEKNQFLYQWQRSTDGENFYDIEEYIEYTNINGDFQHSSTEQSYILETDNEDAYYRCKVICISTNLKGTTFESEPAYSQAAHITYIPASIELDGKGTKEQPYLIKNLEDLEAVRDEVNENGNTFTGVYFKITADITLPEDWKPIGSSVTNKFCGSIDGAKDDGNNHLLTVAEGGLPLLGVTGEATLMNLDIYGKKIASYGVVDTYLVDRTIKRNIIIENVNLKSGTQTLKSGYIGGYASGINEVIIRNCTIEKGVVIGYDKKESLIGSFAGELNGYIENCTSYASVYGVNNVGGIMARKGQSMGYCMITNCDFYGTVEATGERVGGILASGYDAASAPNTPCASVINCGVYGTVSGKDYVGGIFGGEPGIVECWANGIGYIQDNYFGGTIISTGDNVGAIIGYMNSINKYNVVENNYFRENCGAYDGIGAIARVNTNCETVDKDDPDVQYVSNSFHRTDDPLGDDKDKLTKCSSALEISSGIVTAALNEREGSFGNWIQSTEDYPIHGDKITAYKLSTKDIKAVGYQSFTGEELDLSGIEFSVTFTDGSEKTIDGSELSVTGYDKNKTGQQTITLHYEAASRTMGVTVLKRDAGTIKVKFTLLGDTKHGEGSGEVHTLAEGNLIEWIPETEYVVDGNATVLDVFTIALQEYGITFENPDPGNYVKSITKGDLTLEETDNGSNSGWMFTINGVHGNLGVAEQYLENGDEIVFHYTDDYTKENWDSGKTASEVIALIDALPEPDMLTLADAAAVAAANDGFSSLSDEDKTMVSQLKQDKLAAAVLKMAELRNASLSTFKDAFKTTGDYLAELLKGNETFGTEWPVIGLARADRTADMDAAEYYADVEKTVEENGSSKLHASKSTENSRTILALTAIGKDVTDVAGYNLLEPLSDLNYLKKQGINGPIWALIALDSHNYEIPKVAAGGKQATRENIIETILAAELEDGGWALSGETADPDMTAMAIQALAPYYSSNAQVKEAVDRGLDVLSKLQNADGGYTSWGTTNSESCAQVLTALTALKIDPLTDARFIKNGNSVMDALLGFYVEGGGFSHTLDGEVNGMATEQGYYALASYARMQVGKTSLYDMSDVTIEKAEEGNPPGTQGGETESGKTPATGDESMPSGWSLLALAAGAGILMTRKKKNAA